ncbi:MAG: HAD-IA family hydrolase, partial [Eubacteriales bacterium]
MMQDNKYQEEINNFIKNFSPYKEKNIVIYGIGRFTATIIDANIGFNIVGLMDKDPDNVGKIMFGLPIIDKEEAKQKADLIIINTSGTYWNLIYRRIADLNIPTFYQNGERAHLSELQAADNDYWDESLQNLEKQISQADVISFDFFDTLYTRSVCNPADVFSIIERKLCMEFGLIPYKKLRTEAKKNLDADYSFDELYNEISKISGLQENVISRAKIIELNTEKRLLVPRSEMINLIKKLIENTKKKIYIISDMYLPGSFFIDALKDKGIIIDEDHILISNELKKSKRDGSIWNFLKGKINCKNKKILHIGDNKITDIEMPARYGIKTYYVASPMELLNLSSMQNFAGKICTDYSSMIFGTVFSKFFNCPFSLNSYKGVLNINSDFDMG